MNTSMESAFTAWGVLKDSYELIKLRFWRIVGQYVLLSLFFVSADIVLGNIPFAGFIISALFTFCSVLFGFAYADKDGVFSLDTILKSITLKKFGIFFLATLLSGLAILGGFFLLIAPGIVVAVQLHFVKFIAVEKNITPRAALRESVRITKGNRFNVFEYMIVALAINLAGVLCLVVGVFFTLPLTLIGLTLIYKKLSPTPTAEKTVENPEIVEAEIIEPA